jgi:hypothetical protein
MRPVQAAVNMIHGLFIKYLLDEISVPYEEWILHTEIYWLGDGKIVFIFEEFLPEIVDFLQDRGD